MIVRTPFGRDLAITIGPDGIAESRFVARRPRLAEQTAVGVHTLAVRRQLEEYFGRRLARFDVPLALVGTPLQVAVWQAVADVPAGTFVSYAEIARAIGRPNAHRAVASALARTPLALFVPAHRVIGADGRVRGAGPGSMRLRLLRFEGAIVRDARVSARRA